MSISAAEFLKWLEVFNIKSGGSAASGTVNPGDANEIAYYATTGDAVSGLTTANNGLLVTNGSGVPSIGNTVSGALTVEGLVTANAGVSPHQTVGIIGTTTNNEADAGSVGEYIASNRSAISPVSLTSGSDFDVASITLGAGDWDVWGNIGLKGQGGTTVLISSLGGLNTTSGSLPGGANRIGFDYGAAGLVPTTDSSTAYNVKALRHLSSSSATIYLVVNATFSTGTLGAYGGLAARRRR